MFPPKEKKNTCELMDVLTRWGKSFHNACLSAHHDVSLSILQVYIHS